MEQKDSCVLLRVATNAMFMAFPATLANYTVGESLHCALLLDYVPHKEPPGTPLGNALRIRSQTAPAQESCKLPSLHITHIMQNLLLEHKASNRAAAYVMGFVNSEGPPSLP